MTVQELKERLEQLPEHLDVLVCVEMGDYVYNPVSDIKTEDVDMREDIYGDVLATQTYAVIYMDV